MERSMAGTRLKFLAVICLIVVVAHSVDAKHKHKPTPKPPVIRGENSIHPSLDAVDAVAGNYTGNGLRFNYYQKSCPQAESLVTAAVKKAYYNDTTIIAGLIRMFFHDCFVRGCDASVLLDAVPGQPLPEKDGPPNLNSLRGFEVYDAAKAAIEAVCPLTVSCADIISFAARDSILLGGGNIPFGLWLSGRRDGSVSLATDTLTNLPAPFFTYPQLVTAFNNKGLTEDEMITLSAAHTVGHAHCGIILSRLYNFQGTGLPDPTIDPSYLPTLLAACPSNAPSQLVNMDMRTPTIIDTNYIQDVLRGRGLFQSDNALRTDSNGVRVLEFLNNQYVFSPAFSLAVLKMGTIEVLTGSNGNIRQNCRTIVGAT